MCRIVRLKGLVMCAAVCFVLVLLALPGAAAATDEVDQLTNELKIAKLKQDIAEAEQKLAVAKASAQYVEVKALKDNLGNTTLKGKGGEVAAGDKNLPFLLWTSMGGVSLLDNATGMLCEKLSGVGHKYLFVPDDFAARVATSKIFMAKLKALSTAAADLTPGTAKSMAVAEIATVAAVALFAVNTISDLSKALRTDRAVLANSNSNSDKLFFTLLRTNPKCAEVLQRDKVEVTLIDKTTIRYADIGASISAIRQAYVNWEAKKTSAAEWVKTTQAASEKAGASEASKKIYKEAVADLYASRGKEAEATAINAFLNQVTETTITSVASTLALQELLMSGVTSSQSTAQKSEGKEQYHGLIVTLNTQDLQVNADNFWSKTLRRMPMLELFYSTVNTDAEVQKVGYIGLKGVESKIDWDKDATVVYPRP